MRFHDYHLAGYAVTDYGKTITLNLTWDYPDTTQPESHIRFSDVAMYHFDHSDGAIVTDIDEIPLEEMILRHKEEINLWRRTLAVRYWDSDMEGYQSKLKAMGMRAWELGSAIGFAGFIIAKSVQES